MNTEDLKEKQSPLFANLQAVGRALDLPGYHVWGTSPIWGDDGKVHVFFSRWKSDASHYAWVMSCEVAHAVADCPESEWEVVDVALKGRGGDAWDSWSIHNPTIHKVDDKYALFYMGSGGSSFDKSMEELVALSKTDSDAFTPYFKKLVKSKRVGLAVSNSLYGPWKRVSDTEPLIQVGDDGSWDDYCTTNPAFLLNKDGKCRLYYKAWKGAEQFQEYLDEVNNGGAPDGGNTISFNRQYGLTVADELEGPYVKQGTGPMIDLSYMGDNAQCEDAYLFIMDGKYHMVMRDMGYYSHEVGLHFSSVDGKNWGEPAIAFHALSEYLKEAPNGLDREGRIERPQILMSRDGSRPEYLFGAAVGGENNNSTTVILKICGEKS